MISEKSAELERKPSLPSRFLPDQTPQLLDEKGQSRSSTSSHEDQSPTEALKRKRKTKTTEALYIKFESSLSKKVTTTMTNGRKTVSSKFASERKPVSQTVDSVKSEDGEKRTAADTPRLTRIIRGNETEPVDKKRKKQNSETCLEHLSNKEHLRSSWARHQTEDNILNPKDSEHRFDAVKDLLNAACKGEDFGTSDRILSHGSLNSKSSSPNLPSNRNLFGDVKIKSANSDLSSDKGAHGKSRTVESEKTDAITASNVKDGTRKSESSSSHKLKERGSKRVRHKGALSPIGQKKSMKKKRTSSSKSKKSSEEGGKEKTKEQTKKAHFLTVSKKSPVRTGSPRSGEGKQKKKSSKVKDTHVDDNSVSEPKPEKAKAKKSGEKLTEKKRKKTKKREEVEVDISEKDDDSTSVKQVSNSAPVRMTARDRSRSPSPRSCSPSMCRTGSPTGTSSRSRIKEGKQVKLDSKYDTFSDSDRSQTAEKSRSLDRELVNSERGKRRKKSCSAASADNIICSTPSTKRLRSTESVPLFVENVLSNQSIKSDKAEKSNSLSSTSSKLKKSEKDLQKAELGWNSSLVSESMKQADEKSKIMQRRKLKYLIVKARNEKSLAPRLRNTTQQRSSPADGESVGSHSENELKSDSTTRDRAAGVSQPKSVQFSESIEDMEAQKNAAATEGYVLSNGTDGDTAEQTPATENMDVEAEEEDIGSVDKPTREVTEAAKEKPQEVPQRSQSTPPVRRRPVWLKLKKPEEQKTNQPLRQHPMSTPMKLKLRNSSDAHLKGPRVSGNLYYPTKAGTSPKTSNVSLSGKLISSRNALQNAPPQTTAPPPKSTKKVIATVGSPVDIKEILEGSSVDALDHNKALVVRPTKSVPAFGHSRGSLDSVPGKRGKHPNDLRVFSAKKKIRRLLDSSSIRSVSSNDTGDEHFRSSKVNENQTSPTASVMTDLDEVHSSSNRYGASSSSARTHPRRKEKKIKKRPVHIDSSVNWQLVAAQDQDSIPRVPYDYSDYDFLQCGLSLMVQRFFNRITNFSSDQRPNNPNASGDMASQRIAE
ncbi:hypothetical protein Btru_045546 [Bulinus truncatus]|nr:hypothetical protein Btru_045546 [Bulinus truncatus]